MTHNYLRSVKHQVSRYVRANDTLTFLTYHLYYIWKVSKRLKWTAWPNEELRLELNFTPQMYDNHHVWVYKHGYIATSSSDLSGNTCMHINLSNSSLGPLPRPTRSLWWECITELCHSIPTWDKLNPSKRYDQIEDQKLVCQRVNNRTKDRWLSCAKIQQ